MHCCRRSAWPTLATCQKTWAGRRRCSCCRRLEEVGVFSDDMHAMSLEYPCYVVRLSIAITSGVVFLSDGTLRYHGMPTSLLMSKLRISLTIHPSIHPCHMCACVCRGGRGYRSPATDSSSDGGVSRRYLQGTTFLSICLTNCSSYRLTTRPQVKFGCELNQQSIELLRLLRSVFGIVFKIREVGGTGTGTDDPSAPSPPAPSLSVSCLGIGFRNMSRRVT